MISKEREQTNEGARQSFIGDTSEFKLKFEIVDFDEWHTE
jgi:hypothetical protein